MRRRRSTANHLRWKRKPGYSRRTPGESDPNITRSISGVRYRLYPAVTDVNNVLSTFVPSLIRRSGADLPSTRARRSSRTPATPERPHRRRLQSSPYGRAIYPLEKKTDLQPRARRFVGSAQGRQGDHPRRLRHYYDQPLVGIFEQNAFSNPPYVQTVNLLNPSLSNPSAGSTPGTTGLRTLFATSTPFRTPRTQQWNVGYQRMLSARVDGRRLRRVARRPADSAGRPQSAEPAAAFLNRGSTSQRPFLGYAGTTMRQTTAYNNYSGLLTQFRREGAAVGQVPPF